MPVYYCTDPSHELITVVSIGRVTIEEIELARREIMSADDFSAQMDVLSDGLRVTEIAIKSEDIERLVSSELPIANTRIRVSVAAEALHYGMARMYQSYHEFGVDVSQFYIVSSLDEAFELLKKLKPPNR